MLSFSDESGSDESGSEFPALTPRPIEEIPPLTWYVT